jgi:hypothetical protein
MIGRVLSFAKWAQVVSICLFSISILAQDGGMAALMQLHDSRQNFVNEYREGLDKGTGFFGMRTKSDMMESNQVLIKIVKTDDVILKELELLYKRKQQEGSSAKDKTFELQNKLDEYSQIIERQGSEIKFLKENNSKLESTTNKQRFYLLIALTLLLVCFGVFIKSKIF